jgi:hypothetical protein
VIAYGDLIWGKGGDKGPKGSNRVLGNGLALFGSIAYAGYEVWYKIKVSYLPLFSMKRCTGGVLPRRILTFQIALPEPSSSSASPPSGARLSETSSLLSTRSSSPVPESDSNSGDQSDSYSFPPPPSPSLTLTDSTHSSLTLQPISPPSPTLFLLYSNLITSLIGLLTFLFLWIPIPLLNLVGWEVWEGFPPRAAWGALVGIIGGGVLFNGCFMVLLSLWGPVVAVSSEASPRSFWVQTRERKTDDASFWLVVGGELAHSHPRRTV